MNVVVGYIDSPEGDAAVDQGIDEARLRDGKLVVVHSKVGGDHDSTEEYRHMAAALERVHDRLHKEGVEHCTHEYVRGNEPVDDLLGAVRDHEAGLLVIGVRTRSATGKLLLGSNSLQILHDCPVPVLCVKKKA
jgi:nucleotide-binding universal stress UspA family protein